MAGETLVRGRDEGQPAAPLPTRIEALPDGSVATSLPARGDTASRWTFRRLSCRIGTVYEKRRFLAASSFSRSALSWMKPCASVWS